MAQKEFSVIDFSVSQERFVLRKNEQFGFLETYPQPKELSGYYESDEYISHTDRKVSLIDKLYQWVKQINLQTKVGWVRKYAPKASTILDMGCGTGDFLVLAQKEKFKVSGVEPNLVARNRALAKGVNASPNLESAMVNGISVITLWHVLEHIPNLKEQLSAIHSRLSNDGVLFVAVPNHNSFDANWYKNYWAAYDVPRHLWHFNKQSINRLLAAHNFEVVATRPMWFDAFYVSLLSEKYKKGYVNYFMAFIVACCSNFMTLFTGECSSLVYVAKKRA